MKSVSYGMGNTEFLLENVNLDGLKTSRKESTWMD